MFPGPRGKYKKGIQKEKKKEREVERESDVSWVDRKPMVKSEVGRDCIASR